MKKFQVKKEEADEGARNLVELMHILKKASEDQKKMTAKEKKDNAIKMGDIYY